jgi:hypothetical protein
MSKSLDAATSSVPQSKSWADVDNDDFFAQVAQDKPSKQQSSPTGWAPRTSSDRVEKRSATNGGVPWSFPNPVPQPQQLGAAGNGVGARFDSLSPNTRRSAPMGNWRK